MALNFEMILIIATALVIIIIIAVGMIIWNDKIKRYNVTVSAISNAFKVNDNQPDSNKELMSQLSQSDKVLAYIEYDYTMGQESGTGYVAITKQRVISRMLSMGDCFVSIGAISAIDAGMMKKLTPIQACMKTESFNVPIKNITAIATSEEVFNHVGFTGKPNGSTVHLCTLTIDLGGIIHKHIIGKEIGPAKMMAQAFVDLTYE